MLLLAGCAPSLRWYPKDPPPHAVAPRAPASVEVYTHARPSKPHVEIGMIEATAFRVGGSPGGMSDPVSNVEAMVNGMRAFAAEKGCDALVISLGSVDMGYRGSCLVYRKN